MTVLHGYRLDRKLTYNDRSLTPISNIRPSGSIEAAIQELRLGRWAVHLAPLLMAPATVNPYQWLSDMYARWKKIQTWETQPLNVCTVEPHPSPDRHHAAARRPLVLGRPESRIGGEQPTQGPGRDR